MGARIEQKKSDLQASAAQNIVNNRLDEARRTEALLAQEQSLLGTPAQVRGQLGGAVSPGELPFAGRFQLNESALAGLTSKGTKVDAIKGGVAKANDLMAQAQAAAAAGNAQLAQTLAAQAQSAVLGDLPANSIFKDPTVFGSVVTLQTPNATQASTFLNSPLAQTVGANLAQGRAFADPNSPESQALFGRVVTQPANAIDASLRAGLGSISSGLSASLRDIDAGRTRALMALDTGLQTSLASLDAGLASGEKAIGLGLENSLRSIDSTSRENLRQARDASLTRGAASRPFQQQAVTNRAEEVLTGQRVSSQTEAGRQSAALEAGVASQRAGIQFETGQGKAQVETSASTSRANLQTQAGIQEAQINIQAGIQKAQVLQQGAQFFETFRANFSFASVQNAQAFLSNQAGVREEFQTRLDNLTLASANLEQHASDQAAALAAELRADQRAQDAARKQLVLTGVGAVLTIATAGIAGGTISAIGGGSFLGGAAQGILGSITPASGNRTIETSGKPVIRTSAGTPPFNPNAPPMSGQLVAGNF